MGGHAPWIPTTLVGTGSQVLRTVGGIVGGWSLRDSGGTGATVVLYDSATGATGDILAEIVIGNAGTADAEFTRGVQARNGVYAQVTGAVVGSIRTN